jgi:hypothetical protein
MRAAAAPNKPRIAKMQSFPAPMGGWIKNVNLATPDARLPNGQRVNGAAVLENWFPTATGIRMRGGSEAYAQLTDDDDITALFTYVNGNNQSMFTATADSIFDISSSVFSILTDDADNFLVDDLGNTLIDSSLSASLSGFAGGDWSSVQFATTGGVYLDLVNGADKKLIYDGTDFFPVGTTDLVSLDYDAETAAFTKGATLTGGTSGATAAIVKIIDNGTTGTLWLDSITGTFQDNETITDDNGTPGSATADGTVTTLWGKVDGIDPANLSQNWVYKNRLFYVEKNSLNAWYLAVDTISGTITKLPLGGVFTLGGSLLFGATWSIESGDGLSEQCAFFTTEGEVAVFSGNDPSSSSTWSKVGTYRVGKPKGPKAYIRAGGDLVVATDIGFIPLSVAVQRDIAALSPSAISYPIETAWNDAIADRTADWNSTVWPTKQMVIVALPTSAGEQAQMFIANARTGAWCLFTGLDATCMAVFEDRLFFGSKAGLVAEMEVTGADQSTPYTATVIPLFDPLKSPASIKTGLLARSTVRAPGRVQVGLSLQADYNISLPSPPDDIAVTADNVWGSGVWGSSKWGTAVAKQTFREWQSVSGSGYALAVAAQITSGSVSPPDVEYVETELTYDMGDVVT